MKNWIVTCNGTIVDRVHMGGTADEVRRYLIESFGFPNVIVVKEAS